MPINFSLFSHKVKEVEEKGKKKYMGAEKNGNNKYVTYERELRSYGKYTSGKRLKE